MNCSAQVDAYRELYVVARRPGSLIEWERSSNRHAQASSANAGAQMRAGASDLSRSRRSCPAPTNAEQLCERRGIRSRAAHRRSPPPCEPPSPSRPSPQPVHASPIPQKLESFRLRRPRPRGGSIRWGVADAELLAHLVVLVGCDPRLDEPCCRHTNLLARRLHISPDAAREPRLLAPSQLRAHVRTCDIRTHSSFLVVLRCCGTVGRAPAP